MDSQYGLKVHTLFLTWRSLGDSGSRYLVGYLRRAGLGYSFTYAVDSKDFICAMAEGFEGYPAFKSSDKVYRNDVLSTFAKRLPPVSRRDFSRFLDSRMLSPEAYDDMFELMSYVGIKLPSDGFDLIPDLGEAEPPFRYLIEVAGTRYNTTADNLRNIHVGDEVRFIFEDENIFDDNAVAVECRDVKVGYVNRLHCSAIRNFIQKDCELYGRVAKLNGTDERPLIYVMLDVRHHDSDFHRHPESVGAR